MAFLFEVKDYTVKPTTEILLIEPFKKIWKRDKTKGKSKALNEFAYMEFMTSMKKSNPFKQFSEEEKEASIKFHVLDNPEWKPDKEIQKGIEFMELFQKDASISYTYLLAAKEAIEKLKKFFSTVDIKEKNIKGALLYKPRDITSALGDTEKLLSNFRSLEKRIEEDFHDNVKIKAGNEISPFANPDFK